MLNYFYTSGGLNFKSDISIDRVPQIDFTDQVDVVIKKKEIIPTPQMMDEERLRRFNMTPRVGILNNGFQLDWKEHGVFQIENGNAIYYNEQAQASPLFKHLIVNEPMAGVFFQRDFYLSHSSAALMPNGKVMMIFGEPGAGKSTTLALFVKHGGKVISDEFVMIKFNDKNEPVVCPFVPVLRLWGDAARHFNFIAENDGLKHEIKTDPVDPYQAYPLAGFIYLQKSTLPEKLIVNKQKNADAHLSLIRSFPMPVSLLTAEEVSKRFDQATQIIKHSDAFLIKRNDNSMNEMERFVIDYLTTTK